MDRTDLRALWRRAQHGWPANFPLVQFPNVPLLVALAGWVVGALASGWLHDAARAVFVAGLAVWAVDELARGTTWLRRLMGAGVLAYLVVQAARAISGG